MPQTAARKLLRLKPEAAPEFASLLPARCAARLSAKLGATLVVSLETQSTPQPKTLQSWLEKPGLKARLAFGDGTSAYCLLDDALARGIVGLRLGAKPRSQPLSTVDLALCSAVVETVQTVLAQWLNTDIRSATALQTDPLSNPRLNDWTAFNLLVSRNCTPIGRLHVVLPTPCTTKTPPRTLAPPAPIASMALGRALSAAPVLLRAVLHRQMLARDGLAALRAGDVIALPDNCLSALQIALSDGQTTPIGQALLGAYEGKKVLKLLAPPDAAALALPAE